MSCFIEKEGVLRCPSFDEFVWQKHGFGSRIANPHADITLRQVHSAAVCNADGIADRQVDGDALVSDRVGQSIGVRTADCVPLLLLDRSTRAIAAIHAGWRGTAAQIARATVNKLREEYGSRPDDLYVAIGPCIRRCCYEVSPSLAELFIRWPGSVQNPPRSKPSLDLAEANRRQMLDAGVPRTQVFDCALCTSCLADRFFSFRREPGNPGRMLSSICRI
ncbi:MAG: peptidoglycan editing factor PgeF [Acidobacteriaceae bacterium]|nr:peptidoglycan editing factor PgeF [Acidobacteriaceae bacterium]